MCSGTRKPSSLPSPSTVATDMNAGGNPKKHPKAAILLKLSASDDLPAFKRTVEDGLPLDSTTPWSVSRVLKEDMCNGTRKPSPPPSPSTIAADMNAGGDPKKHPEAAVFLELSASDDLLAFKLGASDDLPAFKRAVEDGLPLDSTTPWYCRSPSRRTIGFEQRTPLMIAALYGSPTVLAYILSARPAKASRRSPSDGATPLHCAAFGGSSSSSLEAVKMLIDASADVDALDVGRNRPDDVIARQFCTFPTQSLEGVLKPSCMRISSPL